MAMFDMHIGDNGGEDGSSYRQLYGQSLAPFLQREGRSAVEFAELLENLDAAVPPCGSHAARRFRCRVRRLPAIRFMRVTRCVWSGLPTIDAADVAMPPQLELSGEAASAAQDAAQSVVQARLDEAARIDGIIR